MALSPDLVTFSKSFQESQTVTINKNTVLFRCHSPDEELMMKPYRCKDTGKIGIYFSNTKWIPLGMILEYKKPLRLLKYITKSPIKLYNGKYTYRYMEPERFFESKENFINGIFKLNVDPTKSQYWNHIQSNIYPIHPIFNHLLWSLSPNYELFLTDQSKIELVEDFGVIDQKTALTCLNKHIQSKFI